MVCSSAAAFEYLARRLLGTNLLPLALPQLCWCSRTLWRATLRTQQFPPPCSGSRHPIVKSTATASETPPPIAALPPPETCAAPSDLRSAPCAAYSKLHTSPLYDYASRSYARTTHSAHAQARALRSHTPDTCASRALRAPEQELANSVQHLLCFRGHFRADAVTGENDKQCIHNGYLFLF